MHKPTAIWHFVSWQLYHRVFKKPKLVEWTQGCKLWLSQGLSGATGNHYCGLHEFEEMSFLLHFLRPSDLFVDVGANIGSYTILASAAIGANSISFEPIPSSFKWLQQNIIANRLQQKATVYPVAISDKTGLLHFTTNLGPMNHITTDSDSNNIEVQCDSLDNLLASSNPNLIKIDVEGYENDVLVGASGTLMKPSLQAMIIEMRDKPISPIHSMSCHEWLLEKGFLAYTYEPFERKLILLTHPHHHNTIYIRDFEFVNKRLQAAPSFLLWNTKV